MMMNLTDKEIQQLLQKHDQKTKDLIEGCRNGDRKAFNQFVRQYQDDIFSHVCQMMGDDQHARHITRDIFVKAYKSFSTVHNETPINVWLFKIAEDHIQSALRKRKRFEWPDLFCLFRKTKEQEEYPERDSEPKSINDLLTAYMDGELSDFDTKRVEEEVEKNPDYRQEYKTFQQVDNLLRFHSQQHAPTDLRFQISAKLDEKTFLEKVYEGIEEFRAQVQERRLLSHPQIVAIAASIIMVFSGMLVYQYNQIQIQRIRINELETQGGLLSRSGETSQELSGDSFVILTGKLAPQTMSLKEVQDVASMTSEPAHTEFPFISGDIEKLRILVKERINAMRWKIREDRMFEKNGLIIWKLSAEIPENSSRSFLRFLHRLQEETGPQPPPIAAKTTPVEIYIIDKR